MAASYLASIRILGRENEVDSFAACVQAAMTYWGRRISYDDLAGLSGAAFSPALSRRAACTGWWVERGNDGRVEFLGHALGFTVERSPRPTSEREEARSAFIRRASNAVEEGEVVLCGSWPSWGIVTSWRDGPSRISVACPEGVSRRCELTSETCMYVLRPANRSLTRCEALREAIRFGAAVAAGSYQVDGFAYGGRLYDAWLAQLQEEHLCPECGQDGCHCAARMASRSRATQLSAVRFLNGARAFLPSLGDNGCAHEAEAAYAAMAEKLTPYVQGRDLNEVWSEPEKRSRYVEDIREVRQLHHVAAHYLSLLACTL